MPTVAPRHGDIFEGGADLTVLPCSGKGTISSATRRWKDAFHLPTPEDLPNRPKLGEVSQLIAFPGDPNRTKFVVYAASVFNDATSLEAIESIARGLGEITQAHKHIRQIEAPLLGTGAGRLSAADSIKSLAKGFQASAAPEAQLLVFAFAETYKAMAAALDPDGSKVWDAVNLRPGVAGFSIDLKKLFRRKR